ncbi:bifunctional 2-polyprenyl-6-hydroxyphenol methylase/3-demethylubiquinol 3-O-methyltransferase UbiG [Lentimicrobium sp. S6]|uniref:class I SAM-dependent methyltransferase n=1 Tax=Lentimicrobium sp. S6 TaxID=2735872 RepID=UPI00155614E4|nr:class I SAM-dependent methyltransferase [Lentimicrobium sp. S6]NPD45566.1 class I SAM-dependent methyltransferase [Lentimicrobium sp. S6]
MVIAIVRATFLAINNFELNYAYQFCESYLRKSLEQNNVQFYWLPEDLSEDNFHKIKESQYVITIKDPLLIINWQMMKRMVTLIDKGYDECGPMFNFSDFSYQVSSPLFAPLNTTTYEELQELYQSQALKIQKVDKLDDRCILYSSKSFLKRKNNHSSFYKSNAGLLLNSFVFTFKSFYNRVRTDLVQNIPNDAQNILDVGCFDGNMGKFLLSKSDNIKIDGIEPCETSAKVASKYYNDVFNGYLEDFKTEKKYDAIVCGDILEHLNDPWFQLKRISNFIRTDGCLILSIPNAGHWTLVFDQLNGKFEYLPWGLSCVTHIRWFTEKSIKEAIESAGFEIENISYEQIPPSPKGQQFIEKIVELKLGNKKSLMTNEFLIKAKKR